MSIDAVRLNAERMKKISENANKKPTDQLLSMSTAAFDEHDRLNAEKREGADAKRYVSRGGGVFHREAGEDNYSPWELAMMLNNQAAELESLRAKVAELGTKECHHGWRGSKPDGEEVIRTPCPACGGQLFVGSGGHLTCAYLGCREPGVERAWQAMKAKLSEVESRAEAAEGKLADLKDSASLAALHKVTREREAAEARGRELERDRERLDWLAAHPEMLVWNNGSYCGVTDTGYDDEPTNPKRHLALSCETIRDAIDMAKDPDRNRPLVRRPALAREESGD